MDIAKLLEETPETYAVYWELCVLVILIVALVRKVFASGNLRPVELRWLGRSRLSASPRVRGKS